MNKKPESRIKKIGIDVGFKVISVCLFIIIWSILSSVSNKPAIPSISRILNALRKSVVDKDFGKNILSTMKVVFLGITTGALTGFILGMICSYFKVCNKVLAPMVKVLRTIPAIALFPLIIVILGIGDMSRVFVIFWTAYPPVFIATMYGINNVDKSVLEAGSMVASKFQIFRDIKLPLATLEILNGLKIAIGTGFISVVTAEMLGATRGIGFMITWKTSVFKYDYAYAYIIVIAFISIIFDLVLNIINKIVERRIF